jgi:hypothetical protein
MAISKQPKPAAAVAASGLQIIERLGQLLTINDTSGVHAWQTESRYTIFIEAGEKGRYSVRHQDQSAQVLLVSRQPLLDCARLFLSLGANPRATIAMRRRGKDRDDLHGPIAVAAKLTVDETKTIFAKWKPFPQSAVQPESEEKLKPSTDAGSQVKISSRSDRRRPKSRGSLTGSVTERSGS